MKLVNYGAGELSDRLTILALKILIGSEAGKDVAHFEQERAVLLTQIRSRTLNGVWFEQVLALGAVNAALWHAEDDLRTWREKLRPTGPDSTGLRGPGEGYKAAVVIEVVDLAFRIQALNDARAELIRTINVHAGDEVGREKIG